ncbi:hypothetical protein GCM10007079_21720 [Nocardiopsis terrae]|nr:hypothetical protein GCM10007079_21720 [Nocardiopsis terrae]
MESTLTRPRSTSETPNPSGFSPPRKRPRGAFKGIGFILAIWVQQVYRRGVLPTLRSLSALLAIADVVDADGRWCYFLLENLAERSGGTLSVSSLKRAIDDLVEAGVVRKLTRSETIEFFARDIERGRSSYQLPCVLELLIPAEDYPEVVLEEINACRAQLGEEPLDSCNRPSLKRRGTPVQIEPAHSSDRPTDCFPGDCSDEGADGSVRGSESTGEQTRTKPRNGPFGLIDRIPDTFLSDPVADRVRLGAAVEKLLCQGLSVDDARGLISGLEALRRPFPALMWRMRNMRSARQYLDGLLGRGIHSGLPAPSWPVPGEGDPFAQPERFLVDSQGRANRTCPEHGSTRNVPGGTCVICGRRCRSVPGELMHEPVPAPSPENGPRPAKPSPAPEEGLDPELLARMSASLSGGSTPGPVRAPRVKRGPGQGSGISAGAGPPSMVCVTP